MKNFRPHGQIRAVIASLAAGLVVVFVSGPTLAQATISQQQADRGRTAYLKNCASCHGGTLKGTGHGPALTGSAFSKSWGSRHVAELLAYNQSNMPPGLGASLSESEHLDIIAYILSANGVEPGEVQLAADTGWLMGPGSDDSGEDQEWQSWSEAGTIAGQARSRSGFVNKTVEDFEPVTAEMLTSPPAEDWLSWRRTLDGQGHSSLKQIDRTNVKDLRLAWVVAMNEGSNQTTPLVHDGVMFLTHPGNAIQALDAATGELIWEYEYSYPPEAKTLGGPTRNIAIYGDKLFLATYDAAVVAIDARTGEQLWRSVKADYRSGLTHTSGPIIANGVVISGLNGCERFQPEGCFITGHNPATGEEMWRTSTIALPGDPNSLSWGSVPTELRAGSDTWIAGSYDPELDLFYIGTSQAKPWVAASRGMSPLDPALYTNSTLALNPRTGEIVWYFQHIPGETIDMEVGFERVLVDRADEQLLLTVGKDGILWKLDRRSGRFLDYVETIEQDIFVSIDRRTGRVLYRPDIIAAGIGDTISACPGIYGGHNWQATAYVPESGTLLVPLHQLCAEMVGRDVELAPGSGGYGGNSRSFPMPGKDGMLGRLVSIDVDDMREVWSHEQPAMFMTGVLTTAGSLAFVGDLDRYFKAFDVDTGLVLWQTRLGAPLQGFPVSYAAQGRQFIAVPTGIGVFRALTAVISPEIYQPTGGHALYVFELGD